MKTAVTSFGLEGFVGEPWMKAASQVLLEDAAAEFPHRGTFAWDSFKDNITPGRPPGLVDLGPRGALVVLVSVLAALVSDVFW